MKINGNYAHLEDSYLFSTISRKVGAFQAAHPEREVIRLGIGDVTRPLSATVVAALAAASREMGDAATFRGYGEEQGYAFLREAIASYYAAKSVALSCDEIFVSDGAKSDLGNILDLFDADTTALIPDPVYPVYVDTNVMAGRRIVFADGTDDNGFLPMPDEDVEADLIYLCSPNNPTGAVYTREQLARWVDYARARDAVILFDAAYEAFITDDALPTSIYQVPGADECAIEFCSLSKTAGFTGTRCGYTVVPEKLVRGGQSLRAMWLRRQTTKFNGVSYIVQRGAQAAFSEAGLRECREAIAYYKGNARIIAQKLEALGVSYTGGAHSPYIWLKCPDGMGSWALFDLLLREANVVGTPGAGFGRNGEDRFRLSAFGQRERVAEAMARIERVLR